MGVVVSFHAWVLDDKLPRHQLSDICINKQRAPWEKRDLSVRGVTTSGAASEETVVQRRVCVCVCWHGETWNLRWLRKSFLGRHPNRNEKVLHCY